MKNDIQKTGKLATIISTLGLFVLSVLPASAQVTPGGTVGDAAIYVEAEGLEALAPAAAAGAYGPLLAHDFDTEVLADATYQLNPGGDDASFIALSSGRHLVLYNTRFQANAGANRSEIQTWLTLAGEQLAAGRSQGYIRRTGNANEAVLSGGAIITSPSDNARISLRSRRSDNNAAYQPARNGANNNNNKVLGSTAIQFFKLDNGWDYLSLELGADILLANNANYQAIAYDVNASPDTLGTAFTVAGGNVTLNEEGLYLVFANTGLLKPTNNTRTNYLQHLTLDGAEVAGSVTTTYIRGNEDTQEGVASLGMMVRAAAGQVLSLQVRKETGTRSTVKAGQAALNIVKLPASAAFLALGDATNQEINDVANPDPVTFADQIAIPSKFSHTRGQSEVAVSDAGNYLFLANVYTQSDTVNDNQDRTVPLHGWQVNGPNGPSGMLPQGRGAQYNRDNGNRISGSWGAGILPLDAGNSVQLLTSRLGNLDQGLPNKLSLQALNLKSLVPSNDPSIAVNEQLSLLAGEAGTISSDYLLSVDADDEAEALTYIITGNPSGGTLARDGVALPIGEEFTQADINAGLITFTAGNESGRYGFDFELIDDSDSGAEASGFFSVGIGAATALVDDLAATDEDTVLGVLNVLENDTGTALTVVAHDPQSTLGATVLVDALGNVSYDPVSANGAQALDTGDTGQDSFTYRVVDFADNVATATVTIDISGLNDAPVVAGESASISEGGVSRLNLLANDSDVDANDVLSVASVDAGEPGTFTSAKGATVSVGADGSFSYDPSTSLELTSLLDGANASETFSYEVSDGDISVTGSVTITIVGAPGASGDVEVVAANGTINIESLSNDTIFGGEPGIPTFGALLDLNAATVGNTDDIWNNAAADGGSLTMDAPGTGSILNLAPEGTPPGVSAIYSLDGTGGAIISDAQTAGIYGPVDISRADASIELVFRPADQQDNEPLWGTGGNGTGASIILMDNQVVLTVCQGAIVAQAVAPLPAGAIAGGDFVYALGTIDLLTDTVSLYINNSLADSAQAINITSGNTGDLVDWSGTEDEGIGRSQGTTGGDTATAPGLGVHGTIDIPDFNEANDRFEGDIALVRVYTTPLLDETERKDNFEAIFGAGSTPVAAQIADLAGTANPAVGAVVNLPSGATVTVEEDGSLTYDPNGGFDSLGIGLSAVDSFTYTLAGTVNNTATVYVTVNGTNTDVQITIAADQDSVTEGTPAGFTLSAGAPVDGAVEIALSYSGTATDGSDFTGVATATIADGASSVGLDVATIADSLHEGIIETLTVMITGISGAGATGATTSATTAIEDGDIAPEHSIAAVSELVRESQAIEFTVTASVPSTVDTEFTLSYTGDADPDGDFIATYSGSIPAGATTGTISMVLLEDGKEEGDEALIGNLESVSLGSVSEAGSEAFIEVDDGAGGLVFQADFEGVTGADTPGGTLLNTDAPAAANAGTAVGSWQNIFTSSASGSAPGVVSDLEDIKGDGIDNVLRLDRPGTTQVVNPGDDLVFTDVTAQFAAPIDLSGTNTGLITMDLGQGRTQNNTEDKSSYITGYDSAGNVSFRLFLSANNNGANDERLHHVAADGTLTPLGTREDFRNIGTGANATPVPNQNTFGEGEMTGLTLVLGSAGYTVSIDRGPDLWGPAGLIDGNFESTSALLPYAGEATQLSRIVFSISTSTNTGVSGGLWVDDLCAGGIVANQAPGLSTDAILVDGGSTEFDEPYVTGSIIPFSETDGTPLQVSDPDAGEGIITITLKSVAGLSVFDVFSIEGGASIIAGSNNSGELTISGTLADINATLAAGVNLIAGDVPGQETLTVTVNDGGNTGFGGALTVTHSAVVNITSNPIVTVNQAAGQEDPTSGEVINFTASFSEAVEGLEASDVDLSGSSAAGQLVARVTPGLGIPGAVYNIAVTGMSGSGDVVASLAEGAANRVGDATTPSGASTSGDNSVSFEKNLPPLATNANQSIDYEDGAASVAIGDIVVSDGNESISTAGITTDAAAFIDYPAVDTTKSFTSAVTPDVNNGFSLAIKFTPVAADVEAGSEVAGEENRHRVYEYGGSSNGHGLYLVNGVLYFACKMNTNANAVPSSLNDTDWADDGDGAGVGLLGSVMFPLTGALAAGQEVTLALIFDLDSVRYSVNGGAEGTQALSGRGAQNNWRANRTVNIGTSTQSGQGGTANVAGTFRDIQYVPMGGDNPVAAVQVYNVSGEDAAINILGEGQEITAILTLDDAANGALSAESGNGETYNAETGVWSVSGSSITVNAALAAVSFVPNANSPESVQVSFSVEDDDQDGSAPFTGTITLNAGAVQVTALGQWRLDNGYSEDGSGEGEGNLDVPAPNGLSNLENFALGFDAKGTGSGGEIAVDGNGAITAVGGVDIHEEGGTYYLRYTRRADYADAGLTIAAEFSSDLKLFEALATAGSVIGTGSNDGIAIEALQVELPAGSNYARLKTSITE